jgi:hypothetical protein
MRYSEDREVSCRDPAYQGRRRSAFAQHFTRYSRLPQYLTVQLVREAENRTLVTTPGEFNLKANGAVISVEGLGNLHRSNGGVSKGKLGREGISDKAVSSRVQGIDEGWKTEKKVRVPDTALQMPNGSLLANQPASLGEKYVILLRFSIHQKKTASAWTDFIAQEKEGALQWLQAEDESASINDIEVIKLQRSALSNLAALTYAKSDKPLPVSSRPSRLRQLRQESSIKTIIATSYD